MVICETLPLLPDTEVDTTSAQLSEPVEVGPFLQGRVFLKMIDATLSEDARLTVEVGLSPYGYDDWDEHWTVLESIDVASTGMTSVAISNFGNWLRLRLTVSGTSEDAATVLAWFSGKG